MITTQTANKKSIVDRFIKKGILVSEAFIDSIDDDFDFDSFYKTLVSNVDIDNLVYLNKDYLELINRKVRDINFIEVDKFKTLKERSKSNVYDKFIELTNGNTVNDANLELNKKFSEENVVKTGLEPKPSSVDDKYPVKILESFNVQPENVTLNDFVKHLNIRYKSIEKLLRMRTELSGITSISRVLGKKDKETVSMKRAIEESRRRRRIQKEYNRKNHITPASIEKNIDDILRSPYEADYVTVPAVAEEAGDYMTSERLSEMVEELTAKMKTAAKRLEFEEAIRLRDQIKSLEEKEWEALTFG